MRFVMLAILALFVLILLYAWLNHEKQNAVNLPRDVFGVKLGDSKSLIKKKLPNAIVVKDGIYELLRYSHPKPEIESVYFNFPQGREPILISFNINYEKQYSQKVSFQQFLSELEKRFGPSSEYMDDREFVQEQRYWKDGMTRIVAGQGFGSGFFLSYEDLKQ